MAGELEAWRASKSKGLEKQLDCGAWKSGGAEGEGLTTTGDMMRAGDWRQGTGGKEGKKAGAGDSGQREEEQETAAAQWQRSLIFSSQSKNCGVRSGGSLLAGLNYALVDSLEFGGATHKSV